MSWARDAGFAIGLLCCVALLGVVRDATLVPALVVGGAGAAVGAEVLAYQRPGWVRGFFERATVLAGTIVLALAGIAAGAILAPDGSLSVAAGALGAYLLLLGIGGAIGVGPTVE